MSLDLSFPRLSPAAAPIAPPADAARALAVLSAYRCAVQATGRDLLAPADGAFNLNVAQLLCATRPNPRDAGVALSIEGQG